MLRNSKRKALFEVIGRDGSKTSYEQLHSSNGPNAAPTADAPASPPSVIRWERKPGPVRFNAGRVEFSLPYQLAVAVVLGVVLLVVVTFRLGQWSGSGQSAGDSSANQASKTGPVGQSPRAVVTSPAEADSSRPLAGRNRIVIQMFQVRTQLEPVKDYFDKMGVGTEIIERDNWYYLVTKNKYNNIDKAGTDGYLARQKIVELGAGYKAPPGYESFGVKPFSGAFGMKFEE